MLGNPEPEYTQPTSFTLQADSRRRDVKAANRRMQDRYDLAMMGTFFQLLRCNCLALWAAVLQPVAGARERPAW